MLRAVQEELRRRRGGALLDSATAYELAGTRFWALRALKEIHATDASVKALEQANASADLLAICVGSYAPVPLPFGERPAVKPHVVTYIQQGDVRTASVPSTGCLVVFAERVVDPSEGRKLWPRWCAECSPEGGKPRKQLRAYRRLVLDRRG